MKLCQHARKEILEIVAKRLGSLIRVPGKAAFCFHYSSVTIAAVDHLLINDRPDLWPTEVAFRRVSFNPRVIGQYRALLFSLWPSCFLGHASCPNQPQSRKNLLNFVAPRKNFKRTWEREVAMEDLQSEQ